MASAKRQELDDLSRVSPDGDLSSLFREIHGPNVRRLNSLYPRGAVLFAEGEPARGIFLLRTGTVSVSISSSDGKVVILRTAQTGAVLGLNSALQNTSYDTTVKTLEPCGTDFISRVALRELIGTSHVFAHALLKMLSQEVAELTDRARLLLLPQTAQVRLAKLLLEWARGNGTHQLRGACVGRPYTHEEIAQMICASRETVTRLLGLLSRRQVIRISSSSIQILDRVALETIAVAE